MQTHVHLLEKIAAIQNLKNDDLVHATLASEPSRVAALQEAVMSLVHQVDILHVFLNGFDSIPGFLDHKKIYITRSQDFGDLGECGKYYWTGDFSAYHFIVSDSNIYPANYVEVLKNKLNDYQRKAVVGTGGYRIKNPFQSLANSSEQIPGCSEVVDDAELQILEDGALAFHSSTISVNRHHFYQPQLSSLWFSVLAIEQSIPLICIAHSANWVKQPIRRQHEEMKAAGYQADFLLASWFNKEDDNYDCSHINSCFDRIYVMNLDRRPDRWEKVLRRTKKHNIDVSRFSAVDGYNEPAKPQWEEYFNRGIQKIPEGIDPITTFKEKYLNYRHYFTRIHFMETKLGRKAIQSPGAWGYAMSYIEILNESIKQNYDRIIIFDDDILLHKNFNEEFTKRMQFLKNSWSLIMLGAMQHNWDPSYINWENEYLYHCNGSSIASHAVGLHRKVFLPVLFYSQKLDLPIDEGAIYHIQHVYAKKSYIFYPNLAIQDIADSDINSSVIAPDDVEKKSKLYRWDFSQYDL